MTLAIVIYLGFYSWHRRHIPAAKIFAVACLLGGFVSLGVVLERSAECFPTKIFWIKFIAVWQQPLATVVTCFVLQYAGLGWWLNRRTYILLFLLPLVSVLIMVTNDFHHLFWAEFWMDRYVVWSRGRLYWLFNSYIYLLGIVNFVVLVRLAVRSPGHRLPVAIIVSCQIFSRLGYTIDKLHAGLIGPGESVFLIVGVMSVAYAVTFLRFHAIDPVAAARAVALQQMREGFFVLDIQGRISDVNPVGAAMLFTPEIDLRHKLLGEVMSFDPGMLEKLQQTENGQVDITLEKGNFARHYQMNWTVLRERNAQVIGQLILLHDVTEQRRDQTRILEQQHVVATLQERERLAREIHDGIGQTFGYVGVQAQSILKWLHDGNNEKAESLLQRLVEVAKDAHADVRESILCLKTGSGEGWSFIPALKEYIDKFQTHYGIRTELSFGSGIDENLVDPRTGVHLLRAIQEALTNARKHSGAGLVCVGMEMIGATVVITITDDGRGFDISRFEGGNDGHFGLIFMKDRMAQIGGSLNIDSVPGAGAILTLEAPMDNERKPHENSSG